LSDFSCEYPKILGITDPLTKSFYYMSCYYWKWFSLWFCCSYVSGYKNRFQNFIRYLREMGDEVSSFTISFFNLSIFSVSS